MLIVNRIEVSRNVLFLLWVIAQSVIAKGVVDPNGWPGNAEGNDA